MDLKNYIASIPDFPSKGILFRDVTPLLADSEAFAETIRIIADGSDEQLAVDGLVKLVESGFAE